MTSPSSRTSRPRSQSCGRARNVHRTGPSLERALRTERNCWFLAAWLTLGLSQFAYAQPECVPSAPDGYGRYTQCSVTIDRNNPASPPTIVVRGGVTVTIRIENPRQNESVSFTATTAKAPPVDVAGTLLKNAMTPLQSLQLRVSQELPPPPPPSPQAPSIRGDLDGLTAGLRAIFNAMADANGRLSCLEAYRAFVNVLSCGPTLVTSEFEKKQADTVQALRTAATTPIPLGTNESDTLDDAIANDLKASRAIPDEMMRRLAIARDDQFLSERAMLKDGDRRHPEASGRHAGNGESTRGPSGHSVGRRIFDRRVE
jgi:hypothetical protein